MPRAFFRIGRVLPVFLKKKTASALIASDSGREKSKIPGCGSGREWCWGQIFEKLENMALGLSRV